MPIRRILQHAVVIVYLVVTASAFMYTMTRIKAPLVPWRLVGFSYGMMAPYQGYLTFGQGLLAEGQADDGTWQTIDHAQYMPFLRGERIVREWLLPLRFERVVEAYGDVPRLDTYRSFAIQLQKLEAERGRTHRAVRLHWLEWELKPGFDHDAFKDQPYKRDFILQVP